MIRNKIMWSWCLLLLIFSTNAYASNCVNEDEIIKEPKAIGDLVYRDSDGLIYGCDLDDATPISNPGHVGIYIGNNLVIHAYGWMDIGGETKIKINCIGPVPPQTPTFGFPPFMPHGDGSFFYNNFCQKHGNSIGTKTHENLKDNPYAKRLRQNIVVLAKKQLGEEYDADFDQQKGPNSGDWTCSGFVEKIYESCAQDILIYAEDFGGSYGDTLWYKGGLDITTDGMDYQDNCDGHFQSLTEFSGCWDPPLTFGIGGREFPEICSGWTCLAKFFFYPYTQYLQSTLIDSFELPPTPTNLMISSTHNGFRLNWNSIQGDYIIYKVFKVELLGTREQYNYIGETESTTFDFNEVQAEQKYNFAIMACNERNECSETTNIVSYSVTRTMNFEDGVDRQPIRSKIPGLQFTTTDGYDWIYGDWRAGYNGPYPNGMYFSNGNFFAWLGANQGTGRIDFIGATATYLSVLTSTYSGLTMDAYDINDNWLATSGWATNNLNTGQMTRLTVSAPNMAYVLVHDTGNYWLIDDLEIGDLLAEAKAYLPASFIAGYEDLDTLDQDQSKWKAFFNEIYQTIKIILGWGGSELSIQIYNPDGVLYDEYQSDTPPIIIDIPDAEPGQWRFKITAIDVPENNYPFALVVGIPDATCPNTPPIADAGPDQTVAAGAGCMAAVTLDGSGSSDPDGDPLTYTWTWNGNSANGVSPTIQLPLGTTTITLVVNDGAEDSELDEVDITVEDTTPPATQIISPVSNQALQDGVILTADASDACDVAEVYFYVREADGGSGSPIGYEDLPGAYSGTSWEYNFETNTPLTPDGYYVILTKAVDTSGNEGWSTPVPVSIRNWAVIELLPNTANNKAGRTMPVKFALRIAAAVDPLQPFVYNQELEIRIYDASGTILQTSLYGDTSTDYRIDTARELYITNFKTSKKPAEYVVEIWRMSKNFLVGSFAFETVK